VSRLRSALLVVLACCVQLQAPAEAGQSDTAQKSVQAVPGTVELLDRAAAYVRQFVADFSNVVAQEDFRQDWQSGERRRLTSDFLLVRYPGADRTWLAFRDVTAVNGRPVREQQERLTKLFLEPFADAVRRAEEITREASRHSLVDLGPLSSPFVVLAWLQPYYQPQFTYRLGGVDTKSGVRVRALELDEIARPAVVPANGRASSTRGVAWVEEETGRVVMTEVRSGTAPNTVVITTTFRYDENLQIYVPAQMRDSRVGATGRRTPLGSAFDSFSGTATYSRFRRFAVRTEEEIGDPSALSR
jgi:hypothetical protein